MPGSLTSLCNKASRGLLQQENQGVQPLIQQTFTVCPLNAFPGMGNTPSESKVKRTEKHRRVYIERSYILRQWQETKRIHLQGGGYEARQTQHFHPEKLQLYASLPRIYFPDQTENHQQAQKPLASATKK